MNSSNATGSTLISIIIPVYNVAAYLNRCITSIVEQSEKMLEIILIDDGSTDGSDNICDIWAKKDSRIHVIHRQNGGAASARNDGLNIAAGEFIMFVDADDYIATNLCSKLLNEIKKSSDVDCVICGLAFVNDQGQVGHPQAVDNSITMSGIDSLKDRYLHHVNRLNIIGPCGKLFRRSIWDNLRFTDGIYYEDLDLAPYVFTKCRKVICIPDIGYYYYQHSGSASHGTGTDHKRYTDSIIIRNKHYTFYKSIGEDDLAVSVAQKLLDLIITSACNQWIPEEEMKNSQNLYNKYFKILFFSKNVNIKDKIRFFTFRFFGKTFYNRFLR